MQSQPQTPAAAMSRRDLVGALSGAAVLGSAGAVRARAQQGLERMNARHRASGQPATAPLGDVQLLVDRITQGYRPEEAQLAQSMGYQAYLEYQLDYESIDDSAVDALLAPFDTLQLSSKEIYDTYVTQGLTEVPVRQLKAAAVIRSTYSNRQLLERMVEFWTDHFNIDHRDGLCQVLKTADDRDVIRQHALGKFPDLLNASAHSGAMLFYLDNYTNTQGTAQENYARELMELHTVGLGDHFDEDDVREVARCLTGWAFYPPQSPLFGDFFFRANEHDPLPKEVMGVPIDIGGEGDGLKVLEILATHEKTAEYLATKMIRWFLHETPDPQLVARVANAYKSTGGDIKAMIRAIFATPPLAAASLVGPKFRRPFTLTTSLLRALDLEISSFLGISRELEAMGQTPFGWPAPNGYPDSVFVWGSNLITRWSFASRLLDGGVSGIQIVPSQIIQRIQAMGAGSLSASIDELLTGGRMAPEDVAEVQAFIDAFPLDFTVLREAIALAASSPSYQFH